MPGAVIVADQNTGAGAGSPGVARKDLWAGRSVNLYVGTSGNSKYSWELLDRPAGSATVLSSEITSTTSFTPDIRGSYRVRLITNNGGPGNIQTLVYRVRRDNTGAITGWALPAVGERREEANYGGNDRGWAEVMEEVFAEIAQDLDGSGASLGDLEDRVDTIEAAVLYREISLFSGMARTEDNGYYRFGAQYLDLSKYPTTIGTRSRVIRLRAVVSASGELDTGLVPWVSRVRLYNVTNGEVVTNSVLTGSTSLPVQNPSQVTSSALVVGASAGNLRSTPAIYAVELMAQGAGSVPDGLFVYLYQATLTVEYV